MTAELTERVWDFVAAVPCTCQGGKGGALVKRCERCKLLFDLTFPGETARPTARPRGTVTKG